MVYKSKFAVGFFYFVISGLLVNVEDFVVVPLLGLFALCVGVVDELVYVLGGINLFHGVIVTDSLIVVTLFQFYFRPTVVTLHVL